MNTAKIRNRYNQVPHLTQTTTVESDKHTSIHHTQKSQENIPFPAGDHKAGMNKQDSMTDTKQITKEMHKEHWNGQYIDFTGGPKTVV